MTHRRLGALGLVCLTASMPGPVPAQPARYGDVTPDACAAFGFRTAPGRDDRARATGSGSRNQSFEIGTASGIFE